MNSSPKINPKSPPLIRAASLRYSTPTGQLPQRYGTLRRGLTIKSPDNFKRFGTCTPAQMKSYRESLERISNNIPAESDKESFDSRYPLPKFTDKSESLDINTPLRKEQEDWSQKKTPLLHPKQKGESNLNLDHFNIKNNQQKIQDSEPEPVTPFEKEKNKIFTTINSAKKHHHHTWGKKEFKKMKSEKSEGSLYSQLNKTQLLLAQKEEDLKMSADIAKILMQKYEEMQQDLAQTQWELDELKEVKNKINEDKESYRSKCEILRKTLVEQSEQASPDQYKDGDDDTPQSQNDLEHHCGRFLKYELGEKFNTDDLTQSFSLFEMNLRKERKASRLSSNMLQELQNERSDERKKYEREVAVMQDELDLGKAVREENYALQERISEFEEMVTVQTLQAKAETKQKVLEVQNRFQDVIKNIEVKLNQETEQRVHIEKKFKEYIDKSSKRKSRDTEALTLTARDHYFGHSGKDGKACQGIPENHVWAKLKGTNKFFPGGDFTEPNIILGRSPQCQLHLNGSRVSRVSREHCVVTLLPDGNITLMDLSSNGTHLNGELIGKGNTKSIQNGDEIQIQANVPEQDCEKVSFIFADCREEKEDEDKIPQEENENNFLINNKDEEDKKSDSKKRRRKKGQPDTKNEQEEIINEEEKQEKIKEIKEEPNKDKEILDMKDKIEEAEKENSYLSLEDQFKKSDVQMSDEESEQSQSQNNSISQSISHSKIAPPIEMHVTEQISDSLQLLQRPWFLENNNFNKENLTNSNSTLPIHPLSPPQLSHIKNFTKTESESIHSLTLSDVYGATKAFLYLLMHPTKTNSFFNSIFEKALLSHDFKLVRNNNPLEDLETSSKYSNDKIIDILFTRNTIDNSLNLTNESKFLLINLFSLLEQQWKLALKLLYCDSSNIDLPPWIEDHCSTLCTFCHIPFSFFRRRHHCRICGKIYCFLCSQKRAVIPKFQMENVRVCDMCSWLLQSLNLSENK